MERDVKELREYFSSGKTREASWRKQQLKGLLKFMEEREEDIFKALKLDIGKHPVESFRDELGTLIKDINVALDNLDTWMSGKKIKLPLAAYRTSAKLVAEPLGVVLIIASWNFPFGLALEPLIGAIAAGCTAVIKPSELSPASSALLAKAIPAYVDPDAVKVIQGGIDVCGQLLLCKWDKIFFTGSSLVGRIVMAAAAKNLTPVVLEMGGKCPCIVDWISNSWLTETIIKRLLGGKFGICSGQVCIGVDYILVERKQCSNLVELLKDGIKKSFGEFPEENVARIVNKHHFRRLTGLLDEFGVKKSIVYGGSFDEDKLFIEPTILVDPPLDAEIMTGEIFGPLLPIITVEKIEDSISFINSRPKALAIYCFTSNNEFMQRVTSETSSGSLLFNDTIVQYAADTVPFGGVGESGFGRYHGKFTFDTFSHEKPVLKRALFPDFWFRYPPWTNKKLELLRAAFAFKYFSVLLIVLGLKKAKKLPANI
ncbi:aldehyde dehydrogenase family 3 member F1-like [Chenopodium quinoa]|uniref:aldehyde dehydrogenase family 3 member F1-like n=1 Tax=Chenopodium quinoa TaxID=63459 RepID=UPI000B783AAA|nr:aldehyde dehydrogenase family 3 member F1-like [Chenopodium quinoa]